MNQIKLQNFNFPLSQRTLSLKKKSFISIISLLPFATSIRMLKYPHCQAEDSFVGIGIHAAASRALTNMNSVLSSLSGHRFSGWVLLIVERKVEVCRLLSRETSFWRAFEVSEMSQKRTDYILLQVPQGSECWAKYALGFSQYRIEKKKSCCCLKHFPKLNLC